MDSDDNSRDDCTTSRSSSRASSAANSRLEDSTAIFRNASDFCPDCGAILPLLKAEGDIVCYVCQYTIPGDAVPSYEKRYTIHFADRKLQVGDTKKKSSKQQSEEGPIVERMCARCGNDKMSYATLQLRSADEGQTVFYTCTKCKYKDSENS